MSSSPLPTMPADLEPTRATLHAYAQAVGAIPRAHAAPHPKWWHVSLKVTPTGLVTDTIALPSGGGIRLRMDLNAHDVVIEISTGQEHRFGMGEGMTGTEMADSLIAAVAELGLGGDYNRDKFENDEPRVYSTSGAAGLFAVLVDASQVLERHRATLTGSFGQVQLWPHGFDLAFEWFGTRVETYEEDGEVTEHPSQINFGFYPGGEPYVYANPWPFDGEALLSHPLPSGAEWHTEGWEGTMLPYATVAGKPDAADQVLAYLQAVYQTAAPTLLA